MAVSRIDSDYGAEDRDVVKSFLLDDKLNLPGIQTAEIITFNTIATKGSIRDVIRALNKRHYENECVFEYYSKETVSELCDAVDNDGTVSEKIRAKYSEVFDFVDIVTGTIVSIGSHPCGVLISDHDLASEVGLCSTSGSKYPVSCLYMSELDSMNFVKWDLLG